MKENMLIAIVTSTALGTILGTILQPLVEWIKSKIDRKKIKDDREYEEKKERERKKENAYIQVIDYCIKTKDVVCYHNYFINNEPEQLSNYIERANQAGETLSGKLRLYASSEVFSYFEKIMSIRYMLNDRVDIIPVAVIEKYNKSVDDLVNLMKEELHYD